VVQTLLDAGIARESEGAIVVPLEEPAAPLPEAFAGEEAPKRQAPPPPMIRKRDGAFTYTTSDLATIQYRVKEWRPDAIAYVVGSPQAFHFQQLFGVARRWGYTGVDLRHIAFGSVLDEKGRLIKTREGGSTLLMWLLDQAVAAAAEVCEENWKQEAAKGTDVEELSPEERCHIAEVVGIGAVKYADLSQNRTSDYKFNLKKMVAMDGNTGAYMQYAYARNRSIFRKGKVDPQGLRSNPPAVTLPSAEEPILALQLVRLSEALDAAAMDFRPSLITSYLWDLAKSYSGFFQNCPVLKAETPGLRQSRLLLCDLTARVLKRCLELLGIQTVERM
jgi:arginyl-tRNA synthetase